MTSSPHAIAQADQLRAASQHARTILTAAAEHQHGRITTTPLPPWLAAQARRLARAMTTGRARGCRHITSSPCVVLAAVWAPGVLTCPACRPALMPDPEEDSRCDRCHRHHRSLYSSATAIGPILLSYGLCHDCATATNLLP
jgi:hypothetical protein